MRYGFGALVVVAALIAMLGPSLGQTPPGTPVPTRAESTATRDTSAQAGPTAVPNVLYYLPSAGVMAEVRFSPVERRTGGGAGDVAANLLWNGGGKSWMTLDGESSDLPVTEAQPTFGIWTSKLVALSIRLGALEVRKGKRWVQTEEGRPAQIFRKPIPLEVQEVKPNCWFLKPKEPLKPGEYGFATMLNGPVGDFTVKGTAHGR